MSRLLIHEPPLQVLPSLANTIGLNEAIVLQQIHYWISNPKVGKMHNGRRWVRNSFDEWQETNFPFWSVRTLKRVMANLIDQDLVLVENLNAKTYDRTLWYTVGYDALDRLHLAIVTDCHYGSDTVSLSKGQDGTLEGDNVAPPIPETLSEKDKQRVEEEELAAVTASLALLDSWQDLTGAFPRDEAERREAIASLNRLWRRVGRDTHRAWKLLKKKRTEILAEGKTPYRPAAIIPQIMADLDMPEKPKKPSANGSRSSTEERMERVKQLLEDA